MVTHLLDIGFVGRDDIVFIPLFVCIEPRFGVVDDDIGEKCDPLFWKTLKMHAVFIPRRV
ncbi:hypothetical protein D1872_278500 [compost metagenome]